MAEITVTPHFLSSDEYLQLAYEWNNTACDFPHDQTLQQLFSIQVQQTPERTALIFENKTLTYQELDHASNQLAWMIKKHYQSEQDEIKPDTLIALYVDRSFEMVIAILAVLKAGAAYVPIDPQLPPERIKYILDDTQTKLILTQKHYSHAILSYHRNAINLDDSCYQQESTDALPISNQPEDLAYVIYTSGTTGKPKGVAIPHQGVVNRIDWMQKTYPLTLDDVVLHKTPYGFDVSVWELFWAHQVGASLVIAKREGHQDALYLNDLIQKQKITVLHFVPSMLSAYTQTLIAMQQQVPDSLHYVFCSGEALTVNQVNTFYELSHDTLEIHNLYGPTEASIDVTFFPCPRHADKIYIGKPIQNTQVYVLDTEKNLVSVGVEGELYLGGVGLARGYINKDELTAERFIPNSFATPEDRQKGYTRLYKTGDLVRWSAEGQLEYLGRNDFQVKIRGYRIELTEIENLLESYLLVHQAVVLVQETHLIAYYISDAKLDHKALRDFLEQHLPNYMLPTTFVHMHQFPLSTNGKLDRLALPRHEFSFDQKTYLEPQTDLEKTLASIWSKALKIQNIGIDNHFLELGGHSLVAARIISDIQQKLGKNISLAHFYRAGTIATLIPYLDQAETYLETPIPEKLPSKRLPLTDFQLILWFSDLFEPKAKKMNIVARKRFEGHLDSKALKHAFDYAFDRQEVLHYSVSKLYPAQHLQKKRQFSFDVQRLTGTSDQIETQLLNSINELIQTYPWPRQNVMVLARIFYLENQSELQLCMPHLIADESSMDILYSDLSEGYIRYTDPDKHQNHHLKTEFKHYLFEEQNITSNSLKAKMKFWKKYLSNTNLFHFSQHHIIKNMQANYTPYSTYVEIPNRAILALKSLCSKHQINLNDALCAALTQVLAEHSVNPKHDSKSFLINLVKSTRENSAYDHTIGCFVRVDPIKVHVSKDMHLDVLSKQIHQTILETAEEQRCSSLIKFSCFTDCYRKKSWLKGFITRIAMPLYIKILQGLKIKYKHFKAFEVCWRLAAFNRKNVFLINLNVWNNFILEHHNDTLFGLKPVKLPIPRQELSSIDYILDVCFLRDDASEKPYIVISSNLTTEFKELIANRIIAYLLQSDSKK